MPAMWITSMILIYGDDSSDEKRERVVAVAAVAGDEKMWNWIETRWIERNHGIPFHARNCESDQGDYQGIPHSENKSLYKDLTTLIRNSQLSGVGFAIDLVAQRKIFPNAPDMAYIKAFSEILDAVKNLCVSFDLPAKFTFDISPEHEYNAGLVYSQARQAEPTMFKYFDPEISFAPAKYSARLQVADLIAYESMKALDHAVGPVKRHRKSWEVLRETDRFETFSYSEEWFLSLNDNMPELRKKMGFTQTDYNDWLKKTNRQHNLSNLIVFTNLATTKGL